MALFRRSVLFIVFAILAFGNLSAAAKPAVAPWVGVGSTQTLLPIAAQLQSLLSGTAPAPAATPAPAPAVAQPNSLLATPPSGTALAPSLAVPDTGAPAKAETEDAEPVPQETFGTRALTFAIADLEYLRAQGAVFIDNFSAWQSLIDWVDQQSSDMRHQQFWLTVGKDIPTIIGLPLAGAIAVNLMLLPLFNKLRRRHRLERWLPRMGLVFGLFLLKLTSLLVFVVASLALLDKYETHKTARFVILNIVYALAVGRFALVTIRALLAPTTPALRFVPVTDDHAVYANRVLRHFALVIIYGYFLVDVARAVRMPNATIGMFGAILALILVVMAIVVIIQKRTFVATLLRGNLSVSQSNLSSMQSLRLWFARSWHVLAISYLVIGFIVTAMRVENGFALMLRGTIVTLIALFTLRFILKGVDRWGNATNGVSTGPSIHRTVLATVLRPVLWILVGLIAAAGWGVDIAGFFARPFGQRILGSAFSIGLTIVIVTGIYELFNYACERHLNRTDNEGNAIQVSARTRTLLPMLRNSILIVFFGVVGLVVLSEAGINIGPLLAGAGVVGVAIGFGSQTLVKDFLTGLFIVLENTIAIGDVVSIGTHSGVVEVMSIRTLRLRDQDGAVHILPYSEVTQIINMTKDFAFAVISMAVSYDSDLDKVMRVIRSEGEALQNDPIFSRVILEPIEILGVDKLGDSSITVLSRIRTRAGKQWDVKRQMYLRLKNRFAAEHIDIPFPTTLQLQRSINPAPPSDDMPG